MGEEIGYFYGALGVSILLSMAAYGSCIGMGTCGASSVLHASTSIVITYSYIAMIIISTVFFYAFILAILIINKLTGEYTFVKGITHLSAGILLGCVGLFSGKSMGHITNDGFRRLSKKPEFFMIFLLALASVEVTLVLAFLCALIIVFAV
ncbi:V-type H+-transporting ATPase 16kDa proteolipid subunit [Pancytospora epiphaga]|nr:V-type H+-transporting ATPase 16kDa proteolipid subunit [Pancytospora epiphaga]